MRNTLKITDFGGYFRCRSKRYSVNCGCDQKTFELQAGMNLFQGSIDSEGFSLSYALSMFIYESKLPWKKTIALAKEPMCMWNGEEVPLARVSEKACYIDLLYPPFFGKKTVEYLLHEACAEGSSENANYFKELFFLDNQRYLRCLKYNGNEAIRAMAAVGCAQKKEIFCFPWYSETIYQYYRSHLEFTFQTLQKMGKIIIFPSEHK